MAKARTVKSYELSPKNVKVIRALSDEDNRKIRVAAYCRVSTDSSDQANSFIAQVRYYNDFLRHSDTMELVDIYADEGITGTSTEKRDEFNRMIRDCKLGKLDKIYVKSVSRFARNALDCIENIRLMKSYGVTVLFENDGLDTACMNSEMILYIKSAFAQSESLSNSKRVSTAIRMKMETGQFVIPAVPYGYRRVDKKLVIEPSEAKVVKQIFEMYLHGLGKAKIALELQKSNPERSWNRESVRCILGNEKYVGDSLYQKTYTPPVLPFKTKRNKGEVDQYYVANSHEAIIDRATFEQVQTILSKNRETNHSRAKPTTRNYTGKIYCGDCGWAYKSKGQRDERRWVCSKSGTAGHKCQTAPITEDDLERTFVVLYNRLKQNEGTILHNTLTQLTELKKRITMGKDGIAEIDQEMASLVAESSMYARLYRQKIMDDVSYREQSGMINKRIAELRSRRQKLVKEDEDETCIEQLRKMKEDLAAMPDALLWFDADVFDRLVEKVIVRPKDTLEFELKCGMRLKEKIIWS